MKIAVISDIHGNLSALQAVLADIEKESVDLVVNLGDILSGPLYPFETANLLMQLDYPTIKGNHERQILSGNSLMAWPILVDHFSQVYLAILIEIGF
ncbi:metallophosphoesterase family protein [Providencia rettgeri]|uniref:metallophosphoesterase family protein n=1 Tax=unclassified Providencia TaxID=2633465 RepID=UPI00234B9A8F|nr:MULTISPECIES: metallophosphoesterase [unclassified Providencia]MBZ3683477.1 metallophosphoesterase family protein [Providencia rettgeri]